MPSALAYHPPAASDLSFELIEGVLTISAASAQPSGRAMALAKQRSAIESAILTSLLVGILAMLVIAASQFIFRRRVPMTVPVILLFAMFTGAVFLLVWQARLAIRQELLREMMRQVTVFRASSVGLRIETAGPYGQQSYDLSRDEIRDIVQMKQWLEDTPLAENPWLCIHRSDGTSIKVMPGRAPDELHSVIAALKQVLDEQKNPVRRLPAPPPA